MEEVQDRKEFAQQFAGKLRILRASMGLSQTEIADAIGVTRQCYYMYESQTKELTWSKCLTLLYFYEIWEESRDLLEAFGLSKKARLFLEQIRKSDTK